MEAIIDVVDAAPPAETTNLVLQAARRVDLTDGQAVREQIAREQSVHTTAIRERQEQEIRLGRNRETLDRVQREILAVRQRAAEDEARLVAEAGEVMRAMRANEAAIAILDGAA